MTNLHRWRKWIVGTFVSVPILSSLISTYHLVTLFTLGNPTWLSVVLALTFEAGSVASLLAIPLLEKVNKGIVWSVFAILFVMQVVGNLYFSFDWVMVQMAANAQWITTFQQLFAWIVDTPAGATMLLSWMISLPIPLMATLLSKSLVDYLKIDEAPEASTQPVVSNDPQTIPLDRIPKSEATFTDLEWAQIEKERLTNVRPKEKVSEWDAYYKDLDATEQKIKTEKEQGPEFPPEVGTTAEPKDDSAGRAGYTAIGAVQPDEDDDHHSRRIYREELPNRSGASPTH